MRIAIITLSFFPVKGGMESVIHDLASTLSKLRHDVFVFAPKVRGNYVETEHEYNLIRFGLTIPGMFRFGINKFFLRHEFRRLHKDRSFDIINVHSAYIATTYARELKHKYKVPLVVTCHGHDIQRCPDINYGLRLNRKKNRCICRNLLEADAVVSISDSVFEELKEIVSRQKICNIPNGVCFQGKSLNPQAKTFKKDSRFAKKKIILSVGRNVAKKAFDIGLHAFARVKKVYPECAYIHIGRDGDELNKLAFQLGIADSFCAIGELDRDRVMAAYNEADIYFSPSRVEAFPVTNIEAMYAGLPCIVTDCPGNRDSITHNVNGIIAPVDNIEDMANALIVVLRDEEMRKSFGARSKEIAEKKYNWLSIAEDYLKLFASF